MKITMLRTIFLSITAAYFLIIPAIHVSAHCDSIDGPVIKVARKALETNNVNLVLIWISKDDEVVIKEAFQKVLSVRDLNKEVQELADYYFFETVVRLHRASEGESYTGLKPAGRDLGVVIPAADLSIEKNSFEPINNVFSKFNLPIERVRKLFDEVIAAKSYDPNNVEAGRRFVKTYVTFLHTAEETFETASILQKEKQEGGTVEMTIAIPKSLKIEHEELHSKLLKATKEKGEIGSAATNVAKILHNHFIKEEEFALPPLGLLREISRENVTNEMRSVLPMTDKLKAELPHMLEEHKAIVKAIDNLVFSARKENKPEYVEFSEKLKLHAQVEEEVMYPAAILVGEILRIKFTN